MRGQKAMGPPLGLLTLAAILPQQWNFRLRDLNTVPLRDRDLRWADVVCVGGMAVQQPGILEVMRRARQHGKFVVVGGPEPTSQPHVYRDADALLLGEAETNVPRWLEAWAQGAPRGTFQPSQFPDLATSPVPRFDLARLSDYLNVSVQHSRGCPQRCEFCAITALYGHTPRTKTPDQFCRELDRLFQLGYRGWVEVVDDNFIADKRRTRELLPVLVDWCKQRRYPFHFSIEAPLSLADDAELMDLLVAADFRHVFIGIESAEEDALRSAHKEMNILRPIAERVKCIYEHGLAIIAGFVLGFDGESGDAADAILALVNECALPVSEVSLLVALPLTQLTRRLATEGRLLDLAGNPIRPDQPFELRAEDVSGSILDQALVGLNFRTRRQRDQILKDQMRAIRTLYDPENYVSRARAALARIRPQWKHRPSLFELRGDARWIVHMLIALMRQPKLRPHLWRLLRAGFRLGPAQWGLASAWATIYLHLHQIQAHFLDSLERRHRHTRPPQESQR